MIRASIETIAKLREIAKYNSRSMTQQLKVIIDNIFIEMKEEQNK
ncbi:hypothetical protein [Bacillus sp. AFS017336]|nr:hypothetical protein [Bacillus sp. AFS017336]